MIVQQDLYLGHGRMMEDIAENVKPQDILETIIFAFPPKLTLSPFKDLAINLSIGKLFF